MGTADVDLASLLLLPHLHARGPYALDEGVWRVRGRERCQREKCSDRAAKRGAHSPWVPQAMGTADFVPTSLLLSPHLHARGGPYALDEGVWRVEGRERCRREKCSNRAAKRHTDMGTGLGDMNGMGGC